MSTSPPSRPSPYRWAIRVLAVLLVAVLVYRFSGNSPSSGQINPSVMLPKMRTIPPFNLEERSGRMISNRDLAGKIWVADFIYTTCPGPCPLITASMAKLQAAVANDSRVMLVTFTVDPQTDTAPVLAKYADTYHADPNRWLFLTGPEKPLYDLIQNGFLQVVEDNRGAPPQQGQFTVTHSTYFILVDGDGNMRGSYDGVGADNHADLLRDIKTLEKESP